MKTSVRLLCCTAFCALTVARSLAQPPAPSTIAVSGSAEVKVAPDEVVLSVGIETGDASMASAQKENDERATRALKFLREQGVADADIRTDYVNLEPYRDTNRPLFSIAGYHVRKGIEVRLRKLENFEAIFSGLLANGVNRVVGVSFRTSELRRHRDHARQLAIRAAREKADALAAELGARRGKVHQIIENSGGGSWSGPGGWWGSYGQVAQNVSFASPSSPVDSGEGPFAAGQISVSATVQVTFLLD
jgi:uncharacterized protein YggE